MDKVLILIIFSLYAFNSYAANISAIEQMALKKAPELRVAKNKARALKNQAFAKSQWHDPTLEIGALNFPLDTLNINQEPMTQLRVGLKQMIPRGNVLGLNFQAENLKSRLFKEDYNQLKLEIVKQVRLIWVHRYYWRQVKWILLRKKRLFNHLQEVAHAMYANNKAPQNAVLNAKLQLSKVDERIINANRGYQTTTVDLARWIGLTAAAKSHPRILPRFNKLPTIQTLNLQLDTHPFLMKDKTQVAISTTMVNVARQDYKPAFAVGVAYAHREGLNINQSQRADFISAGVSVELPVFPKNRQDRRLRASELNLQAAQSHYRTNYLKLKKILNDDYVSWLSTGDELHLYRGRLIPEAQNYADSTLIAYQNNKTEFATLAESYIELFNLQLKQEKARLEHAKWKIHLLYLQGK